jgi:hypothetical protein
MKAVGRFPIFPISDGRYLKFHMPIPLFLTICVEMHHVISSVPPKELNNQ